VSVDGWKASQDGIVIIEVQNFVPKARENVAIYVTYPLVFCEA
jgi:hypothetical protein